MAVVAVVAVLVALLVWFFWPGGSAADRAPRAERPGVDEDELAAAERDVQEAPDEERVRDWGPGTGQKPLP